MCPTPHTQEDMLRHAHWNQAANTAIKAHNVHMLAVWESTSMAWDGHVDHGDCTHYCQPGVPDLWARTLVKILGGGKHSHRDRS